MGRWAVSAAALAGMLFGATPAGAQAPGDKKPASSYIGCLERLSVATNEFILTNVRPADQKMLFSGTVLGSKRYRLIASSPTVDIQSWAGYEVTVTGTLAEGRKKPAAPTTSAAPDPAQEAESMPTITVSSVKRHGMTCPS
jgi:hypothetical protein